MNYYILDLRGSDTGGSVVAGLLAVSPEGPEGPKAEAMLSLEPSVTFLIHGFNVNREEGRSGLGNLKQFLSSASDGAVVAILWPGDHWIGFLSYSFEGRDADDSAAALVKFIGRAVRKGAPLSFVTHSLGARVAMETIKRLPDGRHPIAQVCLMAPAIDDFSLAAPDDYRTAAELATRVAVLASREDEVLKYAYPAGDLLQAFIFQEDTSGFALGYDGPIAHRQSGSSVPGNVLPIAIPESRDSNHGDYIPNFEPGEKIKGHLHKKNRRSAALFANDVIAGHPQPSYE